MSKATAGACSRVELAQAEMEVELPRRCTSLERRLEWMFSYRPLIIRGAVGTMLFNMGAGAMQPLNDKEFDRFQEEFFDHQRELNRSIGLYLTGSSASCEANSACAS